MRNRPAPTSDEIEAAIDAAMKGRGMPLARLVKSFSLDDLARGFARGSQGVYGIAGFFNLNMALAYASGRKDERQRFAKAVRALRHAPAESQTTEGTP